METKEKLYNKIEVFMAMGILVFILITLSFQVVFRYVFGNTTAWTEELSRYLFVWFVYITASVAVYQNAHIKIDALLKIWPRISRKVIMIIGNLIFLIYCLAVTYYGSRYVRDILISGQVSLGLGVKMGYMYAAIPAGHGLMAMRLLQLLYKMLKYPERYAVPGEKNPEEGGDPS